MRCDVAVIGAGPAGAAVATMLARRGVDVALVDAGDAATRRIGENLPPAARPWLAHYGIDTTPHLPTRGVRLVWGSPHVRWNDHLYSP
ncbi:MAG TPA: FAD-dependent oxidoreductase, partial [Tahibacter sp.]|nr:FAD-dependent oxidoreductase [Tahibacter sp.]